jgi:hypothetical protein
VATSEITGSFVLGFFFKLIFFNVFESFMLKNKDYYCNKFLNKNDFKKQIFENTQKEVQRKSCNRQAVGQ